jgi:hypothetical protein
MADPTCKTCPWWVQTHEKVGTCHKHAPAYAKQTVNGMFIWPSTYLNDFCGEHPDRVQKGGEGS